jgi:membrane peptidoglycan carboxypeptidase
VFANLGDRVNPMPITRIATGEGKTITAPTPDRKNVLRPDVAYIMDDIMKDVINRGTAAQAQGWGFRNNAGKTAFAGKTGTSRDGWFVGFTPELITVVYVGFDNGDDLGMKGGDSAMPVWADFMKEALALHPEWNGDWTMPANLRKAEIDIRNGSLIRELDLIEATAPPSPSPTPTPVKFTDSDGNQIEDDFAAPAKETFVTNVPVEFRRVELFVAGTVPNKSVLSMFDEEPVVEETTTKPSPTPSPVTETWQEDSEAPPANSRSSRPPAAAISSSVTVMVCPVSQMRAGPNCPGKQSRTFNRGAEPKVSCPIQH